MFGHGIRGSHFASGFIPKIRTLVEVSDGLLSEVLMHCGSFHRSSERARLPDCVRSVFRGRFPVVWIRIRQVEGCCHEGHAVCVLHVFLTAWTGLLCHYFVLSPPPPSFMNPVCAGGPMLSPSSIPFSSYSISMIHLSSSYSCIPLPDSICTSTFLSFNHSLLQSRGLV